MHPFFGFLFCSGNWLWAIGSTVNLLTRVKSVVLIDLMLVLFAQC